MRKTAWIGILLIITVAIAFTACSKGSNDNNELESFEQFLEELSDGDTEVVAAEPFADRVYVIIPKTASAELKAKATELSDCIHSKTQVESMVKYDYEDILTYNDDLYILVGNTDRIASEEATADLRKGDYICKWHKKQIVIAGRDDVAAIQAVDEFIKTILPGASNASLMSEGVHFEHKEKYDVTSVTINKYDLYDFTFVCSEETYEKVDVLSKYIAQKSGYLINVCTEGSSVKDKKVYFGYDESVSGLLIECVGQDIKVCGADEYGLSMAIAEFANRLFGNISDGAANLDISENYKISFKNKPLRVCSAYYLNRGTASLDQITQNARMIQTQGFDVVLYGELDQESYNDISFNLNQDYDKISISDESGKIFCVVYKKSSFDNISCKLEGGAFVVDALVAGERLNRRIIRTTGMEAQEISSLLGETSYNMLLINSSIPEGLYEAVSAEKIARYEWTFGENSYLCSVAIDPLLMMQNEEPFIDKTLGNGYMNLYVYADISIEGSTEFEALKNALN